MSDLEKLFGDKIESTQDEGISFLGQLAKAGLTGIKAKTGLSVPFDDEIMSAMPDGASDVSGPISISGEILPGPADGGSFLERPVAGFLADASELQSLALEYDPGQQIEALAGQGKMLINGIDIDISQIRGGLEHGLEQGIEVAQQFIDDPSGTIEGALQEGIELAASGLEQGIDYAAQNADLWLASLGVDPAQLAQAISTNSAQLLNALGQDPSQLTDMLSAHAGGAAGLALSGRLLSLHEDREQQRINEIEFQKAADRIALEVEHHAKLQEALRVDDASHVETEIYRNGASTRITTDFEARHPDEELEKRKGEDHLVDAIRAPNSDVQTHLAHMHFRSQFEEHDVGITRRR